MDDLIKRAETEMQWEYFSPSLARELIDAVEAQAAALSEAQATIARLEAALRGIAEATDLYEPCGWAVHRARTALAQGKGEGV